jgi:hypothetical protein
MSYARSAKGKYNRDLKMAKIVIEIPSYNDFKQTLEVSDKYAYRISKVIQKELKEIIEKREAEKPKPTEKAKA